MLITSILRQTSTLPPDWKPGQPLPPSVPLRRVVIEVDAESFHWAGTRQNRTWGKGMKREIA